MNRFFSKLDLRDIKIDPTGTRFPPDAEEYEAELDDQPTDSFESAPDTSSPIAETVRQPHVPGWTTQPAATNAHIEEEPVYQPQTVTADSEPAYADGFAETEPEAEARSGEVLKVSARSRPSAVAGAIAGVVRESGRAEVQAIGAGATNQAVKAVAIARDYLRETGIEAICLPAFIDVTIDNEDRTAIRLVVEPR